MNLLSNLPPNDFLICVPKCCASELDLMSSSTNFLIFYDARNSSVSLPWANTVYFNSCPTTVALQWHEILTLDRTINLGEFITVHELFHVWEAVVGYPYPDPAQLVSNFQLFEDIHKINGPSVSRTNAEIDIPTTFKFLRSLILLLISLYRVIHI